jgi:hypothetical protein
MKKLALAALLLAALPAAAHDRAHFFRAFLSGYEEVPSVSTRADGIFEARLADDGLSFEFALLYGSLGGAVTQAHIHFASRHVNGPIVVWLCGTATNPGPPGTQTCPIDSIIVRGTVTASNVLAAPATQQLAAGEIEELIRAMRNGAAYVNVHSGLSPGGEIRGQIHGVR